MFQSENLKSSDNPIVAVCLGSFDMMNGIHAVKTWKYVNEDITGNIDALLRMSLTTVPRQKEEVFHDGFTTILDIANCNWFSVSTIFLMKQKPRDAYYSVSIICKSDEIDKSQHVQSALVFWSQHLVRIAKEMIPKSENFDKMKPYVESAKDCIISLQSSGITKLPTFDIDPSEDSFYSTILSAHLKSQMNTIFEVNSASDAERFFNFLCHFTLPEKLKYSSSDIRSRPNMFFHLQIIERQNNPPEDLLLTSPGPRTLVRLPERQVYMTPTAQQSAANREFMQILAVNADIDDAEQRRKNIRGRQIPYKLRQASGSCSISTAAVQLSGACHTSMKYLICEQRLAIIVRTAVTMVSMVSDFIDDGASVLTSEQVQELMRALRLKDRDDLEVITATAAMFDSNVATRVPHVRESKSIFSGAF